VRILVAEDDERLGAVLVRGLREQGYVVDLVPDGETAASYLRFYQYGVAVIDWRMPKLSGLDLVTQLREAGSAVPVLMLTARDTPAEAAVGLVSGVVHAHARARWTGRTLCVEMRRAASPGPCGQPRCSTPGHERRHRGGGGRAVRPAGYRDALQPVREDLREVGRIPEEPLRGVPASVCRVRPSRRPIRSAHSSWQDRQHDRTNASCSAGLPGSRCPCRVLRGATRASGNVPGRRLGGGRRQR
jgi:CheY-like chemotaxis protein